MSDSEVERVEATVTQWIDGLRDGDEVSAEELWQRYFRRLVDLAKGKIGAPARVFDEEDVAVSAFHSLCAGLRAGSFPQLAHRDDLWSLLVVITARKAWKRRRSEAAGKRGGGAAQSSDLLAIIAAEPTPELAVEVAEESEALLALLDDRDLVTIALRKLEGFSNEDIGRELQCAVRTVERRLGLIRRIWSEHAP